MNSAIVNASATEFFTWNGKVMLIHNQTIHTFDEAPLAALDLLREALENDKRAMDGMSLLNITNPIEQLRTYAACRYGSMGEKADFGEKHQEDSIVNCALKNTCKGYGLICKKKFHLSGENLTAREIEVGCEIAKGKTVEQIATSRFVEPITIHSTLLHIKQKLGLKNHSGIANFFTRNMCNIL